MGSRRWYRVRIREKVGPNKWMKKTKMYFERGPAEARAKYKGSGHIMYVEKSDEYRIFGFGDFFSMGPELLRDLRREDERTLEQELVYNRNKNNRRGYYGKQAKKATN
jgi:hypothetical protein